MVPETGMGGAVEAGHHGTDGRLDTVTPPLLLKEVKVGKLQPRQLITHEFTLDGVMKAQGTSGNAAQEKALKVLLKAA